MPDPISGINVSQALTELLGLTGKLPLQLEKFIVPTVQIGDLSEAIRWGPLAFGSIELTAGGAANGDKVELSLPITTTTQGLYVYIEEIRVRLGVAGYISVRPSPGLPAPTTAGHKNWADTRKRGQPNLLLNGKNNSVPTAIAGTIFEQLPATTIETYRLGWILGENPDTGVQQGLLIESFALNTNFSCTIRWREGVAR